MLNVPSPCYKTHTGTAIISDVTRVSGCVCCVRKISALFGFIAFFCILQIYKTLYIYKNLQILYLYVHSSPLWLFSRAPPPSPYLNNEAIPSSLSLELRPVRCVPIRGCIQAAVGSG